MHLKYCFPAQGFEVCIYKTKLCQCDGHTVYGIWREGRRRLGSYDDAGWILWLYGWMPGGDGMWMCL